MSELLPPPSAAPSLAVTTHSVTTHRAIDWDAQVEYLRGLAAIVREENLGEIIVEQDGIRLHLRSRRALLAAAPSMAAGSVAASGAMMEGAVAGSVHDSNLVLETSWEESAAPPITASSSPTLTAIVSPMVGVYYRAKSPDDPPFVQVGDRVEVGQVVGLVEAMKTFNEITSEIEGEVVALPVENGQLVETGATLISIQKL